MKKLVIFLSICSTIYTYQIPPYIKGHSILSIRSQSTNGARKAVATHPQMRKHNKQWMHGFLTISPSYSHSIRGGRIADAIFGSETFAIVGSQIPNRQPTDILADYFGLSQQFMSNIVFRPTIQTAQCVLDWYGCFDKIAKGLYARIYAPFVWTQWDLNIVEDIKQTGITTPFVAGYMDFGTVNPAAASFRDVLNGTVTFGQMQEPLAFGIIDGAHHHYGFSDVQLSLGYDFWRSWRGHVALNAFVGIPTGTRPRAHILFEPQIGNGKHWEFGLGMWGYALLWEKDKEYELGFYGDISTSYLACTKQRRSFDIKTDRNLSRYMLAKEFDINKQYTGKLVPLINRTTLDCHVRINFQLDIVAMLTFTSKHIVCDIGYNGWIRTKERISLDDCFSDTQLGLKGIQNVALLPLSLSNATQSNATIYGNQFLTSNDQIAVMDNPSPVLLSQENLDLKSAASPRLMTHKAFLNVAYVWDHFTYVNPLLSFGGEIEFEGENRNETVQEFRHTLSLWSLWIKSGIVF